MAVGYIGSRKRKSMWWCKCECGNALAIEANKLLSGNTKSCGCLAKDSQRYGARRRFRAASLTLSSLALLEDE